MSNIEDEIRHRIEAFATDLALLIRQVALESVSTALSGALGGAARGAAPAETVFKRGPGRPKKVAALAPAAQPARAPSSKKAAAPRRAPGARRPSNELAKLTEQLSAHIKAHPGVRMEALSRALGTPAKDLRFPVVKLVRARKVRTEGQKQNMAYFPA